MPQDTNKTTLLHDEFLKLPQSVREWIASSQVGDIIEDINETAGIYALNRRSVIPVVIFRLVTKNLPTSEVITTLVTELKVKQADAEMLSEEIAERIFTPIKQTLLELGVDIGKIKKISITEKVSNPTIVAAPISASASMAPPPLPSVPPHVPPRMDPKELEELAKKYNATRPENENLAGRIEDRAAILEMQKKKMEAMLDVGGKTVVAPKITTLLTRESPIDTQALPTFREEGDMVRLKEEAPAPAEVAPFMLHQESELESVKFPKTFRSNVESNYPRKISPSTAPVKIEIGASVMPKPSVSAPVSGAATPPAKKIEKSESAPPASNAFLKPPGSGQAAAPASKLGASALPLRPLSPNFFSPPKVPKMDSPMPSNNAQKINSSSQKQPSPPERTARELPAVNLPALSLSKGSNPPASSSAAPASKPDPKVQGNTLDLRPN